MKKQDHLALRLARLRSTEEVDQNEEGLFFLFSKGGVGKFISKGATHRLLPGDILVFNGTAGSRIVVGDVKCEFLFWTFSVCFENLLPLFASHEISFLHSVTEGFKSAKIFPASSPVSADCQRLLEVVPAEFNLDHRGHLIRIAATILSDEFKHERSQRGGQVRMEDHMVRVFEKLSASELINLSVGELADRFSCSRRHLNRLFHQHFGISVASLRMEMRLLKAVSLLRDPNIKIINVAEQCGFNHLGLFNTCFKRRFGVSPGQWRKSTLGGGGTLSRSAQAKSGNPQRDTGSTKMGIQLGGAQTSVMATFADKITDGPIILADLKRRDLLFGTRSPQTSSATCPNQG